jgi:hypothetical protein
VERATLHELTLYGIERSELVVALGESAGFALDAEQPGKEILDMGRQGDEDSSFPAGGRVRDATRRSRSAASASPRKAMNARSTRNRPSRSYKSLKRMPNPSCMRVELSANFYRH